MMMQTQTTFDILVSGLDDFLRAEKKYPYPPLFQQACHCLAATLDPYPKTICGLLTLMEQPLRVWWPVELPDGYDAGSGPIYEGELAEEANRYLYEELSERDGRQEAKETLKARRDFENRQFKRLKDLLQSAEYGDQAQGDYVLLRSFLIQHADTTRANIAATFAGKKITPSSVGELYEDCGPRDVWTCEHCGPLREQRGRLHGLRASVCDNHGTDLPHVRRVSDAPGRCRVREGIHWRTTMPGIPEMSLFHALEALHQKHPQQIQCLSLWPGIDRYDIRLEFGDGRIWAVDVKDHRQPDKLGKDLKPLYGEGNLCYDEAFYVFPTRRILAHPNYIKTVRENLVSLPTNHRLISDTDFQSRVYAEAKRLQKKGKSRK